jgi:CRISPR/Cas system-associated exonuclease Cas4 (RecB family)
LERDRGRRKGGRRMKIERDTEVIEVFKKQIRDYLTKENLKGIHLTHLYMPLKSYFQIVYPEPVSDNEAYYFIVGKGYHSVIDALTKERVDMIPENEFYYKFLGGGFTYTVDLLWIKDKTYIPIEIKTTRLSRITRYEDIPNSYLFQLRGYISLLKSGQGYLFIIHLKEPVFDMFRVEMDREEMAEVVRDLEQRCLDLKEAIQRKDPNTLLSKYGKIPEWAGMELLKTHRKYGVERYIELSAGVEAKLRMGKI